jgi:hypothetical protein
MSLIADIRVYVDSMVKLVDANLDPENSQVFGNDNAGKHLANKRYNLIFDEPITVDRDDISYTETIPFKIDIYAKPKFKAQESQNLKLKKHLMIYLIRLGA